MELKITSEAVQRAAEKCSTAKEVLKELFPDAFTESNNFFNFLDADSLGLFYKTKDDYKKIDERGIAIRGGGKMNHKGFFLSSSVKWEIIRDDEGYQVLTGTKR